MTWSCLQEMQQKFPHHCQTIRFKFKSSKQRVNFRRVKDKFWGVLYSLYCNKSALYKVQAKVLHPLAYQQTLRLMNMSYRKSTKSIGKHHTTPAEWVISGWRSNMASAFPPMEFILPGYLLKSKQKNVHQLYTPWKCTWFYYILRGWVIDTLAIVWFIVLVSKK